jgi:inorganic pyrophosphatase
MPARAVGLASIATRDKEGEEWRVVIETPKGSRNKYQFAPEFGAFQLGRILPEGLRFPFDFGFLPSTKGDDGDPLDVLLLIDGATFPGCLVHCRLIGVIEIEQTEKGQEPERNDRLVAVPLEGRGFGKVRSVRELDPQIFEEVEAFFVAMHRGTGRKIRVLGLRGPHRAEALARRGMRKGRAKK